MADSRLNALMGLVICRLFYTVRNEKESFVLPMNDFDRMSNELTALYFKRMTLKFKINMSIYKKYPYLK